MSQDAAIVRGVFISGPRGALTGACKAPLAGANFTHLVWLFSIRLEARHAGHKKPEEEIGHHPFASAAAAVRKFVGAP